MGLTLVAILTAALLLPGIIAARSFYLAGQTREVDVPVPPLSTPEGIALIGAFSIAVHTIYVVGLKSIAALPPLIPLPLANPYALFAEPHGLAPLDLAFALFAGLLLLSALAFVLGLVTGRFVRRSYFYGPLAEVLESAEGDDKGILAYVVSKIEKDGMLVGGKPRYYGDHSSTQGLSGPVNVNAPPGGDPSGGGVLDPTFLGGQSKNVDLIPLPKPVLPEKELTEPVQ